MSSAGDEPAGDEPECSRCHGSKLSVEGDLYICPLCGLSTQVRHTAAETSAGSTGPEPQVCLQIQGLDETLEFEGTSRARSTARSSFSECYESRPIRVLRGPPASFLVHSYCQALQSVLLVR